MRTNAGAITPSQRTSLTPSRRKNVSTWKKRPMPLSTPLVDALPTQCSIMRTSGDFTKLLLSLLRVPTCLPCRRHGRRSDDRMREAESLPEQAHAHFCVTRSPRHRHRRSCFWPTLSTRFQDRWEGFADVTPSNPPNSAACVPQFSTSAFPESPRMTTGVMARLLAAHIVDHQYVHIPSSSVCLAACAPPPPRNEPALRVALVAQGTAGMHPPSSVCVECEEALSTAGFGPRHRRSSACLPQAGHSRGQAPNTQARRQTTCPVDKSMISCCDDRGAEAAHLALPEGAMPVARKVTP